MIISASPTVTVSVLYFLLMIKCSELCILDYCINDKLLTIETYTSLDFRL